MEKMKKLQGFTLIELMIVVAIIGVLSAIAIPKFADLIRKSNEGSTKGNLGAIRSAVSVYYGELEGIFPNPIASGAVLTPGTLGNILTLDNGKYIKDMTDCYVPPYHSKSGGGNVTIGVSSADETTTAWQGWWGYQKASIAGVRQLGEVWVNCTHTDSKSAGWGNY